VQALFKRVFNQSAVFESCRSAAKARLNCLLTWNTALDTEPMEGDWRSHSYFHHITGTESYYPDKPIDFHQPSKPPYLYVKIFTEVTPQKLHYLVSVPQQTVRDNSKEDIGHLLYPLSFLLTDRQPGSSFPSSLLNGQNGVQVGKLLVQNTREEEGSGPTLLKGPRIKDKDGNNLHYNQ